MFPAAVDFVGFGGAEFEIIFRAFGFADHVNGVVIVFDNRPVGDVLTNRGVNFEFVGQFDIGFGYCLPRARPGK